MNHPSGRSEGERQQRRQQSCGNSSFASALLPLQKRVQDQAGWPAISLIRAAKLHSSSAQFSFLAYFHRFFATENRQRN
jgi:hypothetical protein